MKNPARKQFKDLTQQIKQVGATEKSKKAASSQDSAKGKRFTEAVKIMADMPPVSNKEIIERSKRRKG